MIIVTGATGKLGSAIIRSLRGLVPSTEIAATARDLSKATNLRTCGIEVHVADYENLPSLRAAFKGADQVLMVSSNAAAHGKDPLVQHANVIAAAKEVGVRRLVYTSHMGVSDRSAFPPMETHFNTETMLRESGISWTALRNGFYASSLVSMIRDGIAAGTLSFPSDGKVNWTAHSDLADAAAIILQQPGRYDGPTPPLVADEALDLNDIAEIASKFEGRTVCREEISEEDMVRRLVSFGLPPVVVDISLGMFRASRAGEFASSDRTLSDLLTRATASVESVIRAELHVD